MCDSGLEDADEKEPKEDDRIDDPFFEANDDCKRVCIVSMLLTCRLSRKKASQK